MAFDGGFLSVIKREIAARAEGCRVDKIYQPSRDELVLQLRGVQFQGKLLLSANTRGARVQFTQFAPENPATPPMFCMLLRKRLVGARLCAVEQPGLERVLYFRFDAKNEFGDPVTLTLIAECMGRRSNLIFCDENMRVVDAVRRTDAAETTRVLMPGVKYILPPAQEKADPVLSGLEEVYHALQKKAGLPLEEALQKVLQGASPLVCREIAFRTLRGGSAGFGELDAGQLERLRFQLQQWYDTVTQLPPHPTLVSDTQGKPLDFTFLQVTQYGMGAVTREYATCSELLDAFYAEREQGERLRAKAQDLLKLLTTLTARVARRLDAQRAELKASANREHLREYGELLKANLHSIERGAPWCEVQNFYSPDYETIRIPLDVALTPAQNAQKYFKNYRKAHTAEQRLTGLIQAGEEELAYLDSVFDELARAKSDAEITEIRSELAGQGYVKHPSGAKAPKKGAKLPPHRFVSDDGFVILVGRNNQQNDQLTLKQARGSDLWLHAKDIPGAHVIVLAEGAKVPESTVEQAAILAALYCKAAGAGLVPVDYCPAKRVKKPQGAPPGRVIYENYQTAYVHPDEGLAKRLSRES